MLPSVPCMLDFFPEKSGDRGRGVVVSCKIINAALCAWRHVQCHLTASGGMTLFHKGYIGRVVQHTGPHLYNVNHCLNAIHNVALLFSNAYLAMPACCLMPNCCP